MHCPPFWQGFICRGKHWDLMLSRHNKLRQQIIFSFKTVKLPHSVCEYTTPSWQRWKGSSKYGQEFRGYNLWICGLSLYLVLVTVRLGTVVTQLWIFCGLSHLGGGSELLFQDAYNHCWPCSTLHKWKLSLKYIVLAYHMEHSVSVTALKSRLH